MPNFEKMTGNILETAKSFFNLEGISHIIVIIGGAGIISFGSHSISGEKLLYIYRLDNN